jgi:hypothetical protein
MFPFSFISGGVAFQGLLDLYPDAAAAYSLRKLRAAYSGSAVRVRRSSDNAETDIGFLANGDFNSPAAVSFCGAGNGFVTTWYDQSGNGNNAIEATAVNQPQIVDSGSIILLNSKPAARPDGTNDKLTFTTITNTTCYISIIGGNTTKGRFLSASNSYNNFIDSGFGASLNRVRINGIVYNLASRILENQSIVSVSRITTDLNVYQNGVLNTNTAVVGDNFSLGQLFANFNDDGTSSDGLFQEIIIYSSNQSSNRIAIESNQNDYYGVY